MKFAVKLLCEDSRASREEFVFAEVVAQLICDRLGCDRWDPQIRRGFTAEALNGASNVKRACDDARRFRDAIHVIVLYDEDEIRPLFALPSNACRQQIRQEAARASSFSAQLTVVLLQRNLETILKTICDLTPIDPQIKQQALVRKRLNARDIILKKALDLSPQGRSLRDRLTELSPSLAYLVEKLLLRLSGSPQR